MKRKHINQNLPEGIDGNIWGQMTADLRGLVFKHVGKDGSFQAFAAKAKLHPATVANFAYGDTRSPLFSTVVKLMIAVDRVDQLLAAFKGGEEKRGDVVSLADARADPRRRTA